MNLTNTLITISLILAIGFLFFDRTIESNAMAGAAKSVVITLWGTSTCPSGTQVSTGLAYFPALDLGGVGDPICVSNIAPASQGVLGSNSVGASWLTGAFLRDPGGAPSGPEGHSGRIDCAVCIIKP